MGTYNISSRKAIHKFKSIPVPRSLNFLDLTQVQKSYWILTSLRNSKSKSFRAIFEENISFEALVLHQVALSTPLWLAQMVYGFAYSAHGPLWLGVLRYWQNTNPLQAHPGPHLEASRLLAVSLAGHRPGYTVIWSSGMRLAERFICHLDN
jgi:hypothetical protein